VVAAGEQRDGGGWEQERSLRGRNNCGSIGRSGGRL